MSDDIKQLLDQMVKDSNLMIAKPETIDQLIKAGIKFDSPKPLTKEEYLDQLFEERKKIAFVQIDQLPSPPQLANPTMQSLYVEITECILFGLNGAAITLSGIMVEFALKRAIVDKRMEDGEKGLSMWDFVETLDFGKSIKEAYELKIITDEDKKKLTYLKNEIRNPYNHYNIKKIIKDAVAGKVKILHLDTKKTEEKDLPAVENPHLWFSAKKFADRERVIKVFLTADTWVKRLLEKSQ